MRRSASPGQGVWKTMSYVGIIPAAPIQKGAAIFRIDIFYEKSL